MKGLAGTQANGPARGGTYPLFQVVQDRYVVWMHLIRRKLDLNVLRTLASDVLAHAATA
jgi:hypothetical protein